MENSSKNEAAPLSQLVYNDITRCPKCNLICSLSLSDNPSIINYNCENNHNGLIEIHNYLIECKNYALSKELCKDCGKNQNEIKGEFMYCSTCKKFICPNCIINHSSNEDHFSININRYDSLCIKHSYLFYSYCVNCKKNMCPYCLELHDENHKIINLSQFKFPEKNKTEFIKVIDNLKSEINEIETIKEYIVSQFDKYKNKIELEINFMKILLSSYEYKEKKKILNYNIVQNLWNFNYQFDANQKEYFQVFERIKKNFQILRNIFQNEGKKKKDKKQSFTNNVYEIDKEKLFNFKQR